MFLHFSESEIFVFFLYLSLAYGFVIRYNPRVLVVDEMFQRARNWQPATS